MNKQRRKKGIDMLTTLLTKTTEPWEHDSDGRSYIIVEGADDVVCRGVKTEALARQLSANVEAFAAIQAVLNDLDTTVGEGSKVTDLSPETINLLRIAVRKATGHE